MNNEYFRNLILFWNLTNLSKWFWDRGHEILKQNVLEQKFVSISVGAWVVLYPNKIRNLYRKATCNQTQIWNTLTCKQIKLEMFKHALTQNQKWKKINTNYGRIYQWLWAKFCYEINWTYKTWLFLSIH